MAETQDDIPYKKIAKNLDRLLEDNPNQNLVLGTDHGEKEIINLRVLQNPEILAVLQKHGYYHIALEARIEFADEAEQIADGQMSPEELGAEAVRAYSEAGDKKAELARGSYTERGRLVQEASERGTTVHFVEGQAEDLTEHFQRLDDTDRVSENLQKFYDRYRAGEESVSSLVGGLLKRPFESPETIERTHAIEFADFLKDNPGAQKAYYYGPQGRVVSEEENHDQKLAKRINEATGGEKTVVLYGAAHGNHENDLDEHLGEPTLRVRMVSDEREYFYLSQLDYELRKIGGLEPAPEPDKDPPDAYLIVSTGELISGEEAFKAAAEFRQEHDGPAAEQEPETKPEPSTRESSPQIPGNG